MRLPKVTEILYEHKGTDSKGTTYHTAVMIESKAPFKVGDTLQIVKKG